MELILKYFPELNEKQAAQLSALEELYLDWNTKINIISRKDTGGFYERHVLHSLSIARVITFEKDSTVADIGTGGGFPGIPLAILFPDVHFHLIDSVGKKIKVAQAVKEAIRLDNVTTGHTRAEQSSRRNFDYTVSRAVAPLNELVTWSRYLLRKKKTATARELICLKGGDLVEEIAASHTRPHLYEISRFFSEPYFLNKWVLRVSL